ncbi:hypothetical protein EWM64_g8248 [Hericium alpestre]|uniref:Ribosome biogenesis protein NOP53 n=1 Tax=Hericium alpestre TaxID=135208 RepID=A0A4Y9ZMB5_9AGAM|nr:hypothetical protein EWM64_g8248 [Hericium alpestre]
MAVTSKTKISSGASTAKKQKSASALGAPAQHNQSSRKGKKAWRKNVDMDGVEEQLEETRHEERLFGTALKHKKDEDIFVVDTKGDEKIRTSMPKFSTKLLSSHKILAQRSAIPAVTSRPSSGGKETSSVHVSRAEKERMLRMGKKTRKGPLNSVVDHDQFGEGSAMLDVSEAVKQSGQYDVWTEDVEGTKVKAPVLPHPRSSIVVPAIADPHAGTSYNPPVSAHAELLRKAHKAEERRVKEAAEGAEVKERVLGARREGLEEEESGVLGMIVDKPGEMEEDEEAEAAEAVPKKMPPRKTKQQRRKAEKLLAEVRLILFYSVWDSLLLVKFRNEPWHSALFGNACSPARVLAQETRKVRLQERLRQGLVGQRLGKHIVKEGNVDVQLGEELSETLRGLRPEGNLFRDRFLSMQNRALIEPRVPVLPKKRKTQFKEVEKHAWKRFE